MRDRQQASMQQVAEREQPDHLSCSMLTLKDLHPRAQHLEGALTCAQRRKGETEQKALGLAPCTCADVHI